jgi:multicomponent Na+:H+ antiporter subunit D
VESLPVALPLLASASLAAGATRIPRRLADSASVGTAGAVTVIGALLLVRDPGVLPYWFGGWTPREGVAVGISFVADPFAAGAVVLAGSLVTASLVFSWRYFEAVGTLFHSLMMVFLAGMAGFALAGDLFTLFVFFELMSVPAYALTGYKIEERAPLQGAVNFAITSSLGGFLILAGVGLVYTRTGALNMAQAGEALSGRPPDGLVVVALVLLLVGLLVKSSAVPFHFWLADAHAVAPTPVCVLFSGLMVQLGLYGVARVYWTVFSGVVAQRHAMVEILVLMGAVSAVLGSVMCFEQRHLKRLLAFSTVGHGGLFLIGVGLLSRSGLAGAALYVLAHGLVKAGLFLCVGMILHRLGGVDEDDLLGRGRSAPGLGALLGLAGLALAGLPPFGVEAGSAILESAASSAGFPWIGAVATFTAILTGGAVLRATARVFLGWGPREPLETPAELEAKQEERETRGARGRLPVVMWAPAAALVAGALVVGLTGGLSAATEAAAATVEDRKGYAAAVLGDGGLPERGAQEPGRRGPMAGVLSAIGAAAAALLGLFRGRLPASLREAAWFVWRPPLMALRTVHSGHVGDYVTWLILGLAVLGGTFAATLPR